MKNSCVGRQKTETSRFLHSRKKWAFFYIAENKTNIFLHGRNQNELPVTWQKSKEQKRCGSYFPECADFTDPTMSISLTLVRLWGLKMMGFGNFKIFMGSHLQKDDLRLPIFKKHHFEKFKNLVRLKIYSGVTHFPVCCTVERHLD